MFLAYIDYQISSPSSNLTAETTTSTYLNPILASNISLWNSGNTQAKYDLLTARANEIVAGLVFGCRVDFKASTENLTFPVPGFEIILETPPAVETGTLKQWTTFLETSLSSNSLPQSNPAIGLKYAKIVGSLIFDPSLPPESNVFINPSQMFDYQLLRSYSETFQLKIDRETGKLTIRNYNGPTPAVSWTFPGSGTNPSLPTPVVLTIDENGITVKAGDITLVKIVTNSSTPSAVANSYRRLDLTDDGVLRIVDIDGAVLWSN